MIDTFGKDFELGILRMILLIFLMVLLVRRVSVSLASSMSLPRMSTLATR